MNNSLKNSRDCIDFESQYTSRKSFGPPTIIFTFLELFNRQAQHNEQRSHLIPDQHKLNFNSRV